MRIVFPILLLMVPVLAQHEANLEEGQRLFRENCVICHGAGGRPSAPLAGLGNNTFNYKQEQEGYGAIRAIDPKTGLKKWDFKMGDFTDAGILTTATDILFSGGREGYFFALDARNGNLLWKTSLGGRVMSGPMTYSVNGRQYVVVCAGNSLFSFALRK